MSNTLIVPTVSQPANKPGAPVSWFGGIRQRIAEFSHDHPQIVQIAKTACVAASAFAVGVVCTTMLSSPSSSPGPDYSNPVYSNPVCPTPQPPKWHRCPYDHMPPNFPYQPGACDYWGFNASICAFVELANDRCVCMSDAMQKFVCQQMVKYNMTWPDLNVTACDITAIQWHFMYDVQRWAEGMELVGEAAICYAKGAWNKWTIGG